MSGRLPSWLADWLGVPVPTSADSATWQLDSRWSWAPWATLLLVLVAIAWIAAIYARESGTASRLYRTNLAILRLIAIGLALVMLAQWSLALRLTGPPAVAIVVDHSASMSIADHYDEPALASQLNNRLTASGLNELTRLNTAKLLLTENDAQVLKALAGRYRVTTYAAAADVERLAPIENSADLIKSMRALSTDGVSSQSTRLGDALRHVLDDFRGAPPAAIILLSDGVVTAGASLADASQNLRSAGVPLFAIGLGNSKPPRDIELTDVLVDDVVFVNDSVNLQLQVKATGLEGQAAKVTLRREGAPELLAEQAVTLPATSKTLSVRLTDRPTKPGDVTYVVEIALRDDETNKSNNRLSRTVSVRDEKIRVLFVQGYPNYEFRFVKTLLERDPTVQLATFLQDADPEYAQQDKTALRAFPVNRDDLLAYDVVIIGDVDPRLLPSSAWQTVRAFTAEKGGGALFIAGPKFMPAMYRDNADIASMLPIKLDSIVSPAGQVSATGFKVRPTPLGLQNPAFQLGDSPADTEQIWNKLAPLYWMFPVGQLKPGAQALADIASKPVICFQYFGAGRVLFHGIDSTWRWRAEGGEKSFARYWVQTVRFLARGKLGKGRGVQLTTDRREYRRGEPVQLRARFLDTQLAPNGNEVGVLLNAPGQPRRRVTLQRNAAIPGLYEATLTDLADGQTEAVLVEPQMKDAPTARFNIVAPPGEFARTEMDATALQSAAETTHGKYFTLADADRLLAELPAGRRVPIENLPPFSIWNRWWLLAAFLTCITTEWIFRKRKGML
jgi:hypothetical protein